MMVVDIGNWKCLITDWSTDLWQTFTATSSGEWKLSRPFWGRQQVLPKC